MFFKVAINLDILRLVLNIVKIRQAHSSLIYFKKVQAILLILLK